MIDGGEKDWDVYSLGEKLESERYERAHIDAEIDRWVRDGLLPRYKATALYDRLAFMREYRSSRISQD